MSSSRVLRGPALEPHRRVLVGPASQVPAASAPPVRPMGGAHSQAPAKVASEPSGGPAYEAGHAEGLRQGLADAQALIEREIETRWQAGKSQIEQAEKRQAEEHAQRLAALDALLQTAHKALPERFLALERQAIELAYEALCRVCGPHAEQTAGLDRAGLLADLLRQGVHQLRGQPWLAVRLHPRDHGALLHSEAGRSLFGQHPQLRIQVDPTLEPLGPVIESDHGQLDVGLATQLARLRELWLQAGEGDAADLPQGGPV
jgi:flagellar biosynthesis/type III secretory pathway protein FliH